MKVYNYKLGDKVYINDKVKGIPDAIGCRGSIIQLLDGVMYDYEVKYRTDKGFLTGRFKEKELGRYDERDDIVYNFKNNTALISSIVAANLKRLEYVAGHFEKKGQELGRLVDKKQEAYGDSVAKTFELLKIYLQDHKNDDNTYTISEDLLKHILLQVRIIDKQNRIFSNPSGDLMDENPYLDLAGYGLLGDK